VLVAHRGRSEELRQNAKASASCAPLQREFPVATLSLGDQLVHRAGDVGKRRLRVESMALINRSFQPRRLSECSTALRIRPGLRPLSGRSFPTAWKTLVATTISLQAAA